MDENSARSSQRILGSEKQVVRQWQSCHLWTMSRRLFSKERVMGRYVIAWFLGVPVVVLVAIWVIMRIV